MKTKLLLIAALTGLAATAPAQTPLTASELAQKLDTAQQTGTAHVRLRMEVKQGSETKTTLQLQIKERRTRAATELVYQVLWPKERKGESLLLRKQAGKPASGVAFLPPDRQSAIEPGKMDESLYGSDLSYQDLIENFYAWERQAIVGEEKQGKLRISILESRPGSADQTTYGSVKSWIDLDRLVPVRIEKYDKGGKLVRRINVTQVIADGGRHIPANLSVQDARSGSVTEIDGSRMRRDVAFTDRDFSPEGLREVTIPRSSE